MGVATIYKASKSKTCQLDIFFILLFSLRAFSQGPGGTFGKNPIIQQENFDKQRVHWGYF